MDLFDALASAARAHHHWAIPFLRSAAIFDTSDRHADWQAWLQEHSNWADEWHEEFFVPFEATVHQLHDYCALIARDPELRGVRFDESEPRVTRIISSQRIRVDGDGRCPILVISGLYLGQTADRAAATRRIHFSVVGASLIRSPGKVEYVSRESIESRFYGTDFDFQMMAAKNAEMVMRRLWWAQSPSNWIVKRIPEMARPVQRGIVAPLHTRERYIVMSQEGMEKTFRIPNPENKGRSLSHGHRRRACWHTLRHERFKARIGQRIFVKGCWVGPEEVVIGGERYKVLLDPPGWSPDDLPDLPEGTIQLN